jgi:hypothetical protein
MFECKHVRKIPYLIWFEISNQKAALEMYIFRLYFSQSICVRLESNLHKKVSELLNARLVYASRRRRGAEKGNC